MPDRRIRPCARTIPICVATLLACGAVRGDDQVVSFKTSGGRAFGVLGQKPPRPAPTLFVFATDHATALQSADYNQVGRELSRHGVLSVSVDLPCHGADRREGEPEGLAGWRARIDAGQDPIGEFCRDAGAALDQLIEMGYSDSRRIMACGTSRGGFAALHFAAGEERVGSVAAFAPVTDLLILREFDKSPADGPAARLSVVRHAAKLGSRPVWIVIGNHDERVGTDSAVGLARALTAHAVRQGKPSLVELHVLPAEGHRTPKQGHAAAAAWFGRWLEETKSP
jgi:dienelactone hydrolase